MGRSAPRLLLGTPGRPPEPVVATEWRALLATPAGDLAPEALVGRTRPSPVAGKAEKALVAAIATDDIGALTGAAHGMGDLGRPASLCLGLRLATGDPGGAATALGAATADDGAPWEHKFVRRYLPDLQVCTLLAPGVPAVLAIDREAVTLLQAEMVAAQGRYLDAVSLLTSGPPSSLTALALAAMYLAIGQNEAVVALTDGLANHDDLTALSLVARGVALRTSGRFDEALAAFDAAVGVTLRHPGMIAAALGERANLLRLTGEELAAQADLERVAALEGGAPVEAIGATGEGDGFAASGADEGADAEDMRVARARVRRRITGVGAPGTFGGRHHGTFQPEVEAMLAAGQFEAAENLLLGLLDAVEDEAEERRLPIDPTFYLTLADLFSHQSGRAEAEAVRERFEAAAQRYGMVSDSEDLAGAEEAMARLDADQRVTHIR